MSKKKTTGIIIGVVLGVILIIVIIASLMIYYKNKSEDSYQKISAGGLTDYDKFICDSKYMFKIYGWDRVEAFIKDFKELPQAEKDFYHSKNNDIVILEVAPSCISILIFNAIK